MHPVEIETKQQLTVVRILVLARYAVSRSSLSDLVESGDVSHTGDSSMSAAQLSKHVSYPNTLRSQRVWISDFLLY